MTDKYCPQGEIKKLEIELWNLKVKGNDRTFPGPWNNIYGNVKAAKPKTLDETIELANDLMDRKLLTYAERQSDNKRKADDSSRNNHGHQQQPFKRQNVARAYNMGTGERKPYGGSLPKSTVPTMLLTLHKGNGQHQRAVGNAEKRGNAPGNPDANVVTGTFLLNNHYASILFDTGADRSFISTAFSSLINIAPTSLENCYDVELADGKLVKIDTIIRGCTLNFLDHPFNIDLMPVELGSFDVIIGMDWLRRYHAVIVCDEKLVQVPYGNETLTFRGNESSNGRESRLAVISYSKAQEYMAKGCQVFLAQISAKKEEDKSEKKQIEDVPIVRDFPEVFPETNHKIARPSPTRPRTFHSGCAIDYRESNKQTVKNRYPLPSDRRFDLIQLQGSNIISKKSEIRNHQLRVKENRTSRRRHFELEGRSLEPAKIESIKDWASPKTPTEIRQFLGLAGYYRRFIEGFSKIAKSMTKLTQKGIKFDWGEKEENAFQLIKQKLCSAPILALPEGSEDFVVYCDASHKGLGAVLSRERRDCLLSRQLKVHEKNYSHYMDLELDR
ncbi:putative reverse transcriptase domain-containing protein [Tanacetum coccineum]